MTRKPNSIVLINHDNYKDYRWRNNKLTSWLRKNKLSLVGIENIYRCDYDKIINILTLKKFNLIDKITVMNKNSDGEIYKVNFQQVWSR
jgi:hypothetical protein